VIRISARVLVPAQTGACAGTPVVLALLYLLAGCAVGPDFTRPVVPESDRYAPQRIPASTQVAAGRAQRFLPGSSVAADWWKMFGSAQIDALVHEVVTANPGLEAARASLRQSREDLLAGYGVFYPQANLGAGATRERFSAASVGQGAGSSIFNLYTLSTSVSYALDLFGGERRQIEGLAAQVDYQRFVASGAYLTLTGNTVNTAVARAAYAAQIRATEQIVALQKEQVAIAQAQYRAGTQPYAAVLAIQSQLAATEATLPPLRQRLDQAGHLLAVLTGRPPSERAAPDIELDRLELPVDIPVVLPSELVRQRPDILAAEAELHRASANIGVATAAMFPAFTLNGAFGQIGNRSNALFQSGSNVWSLGADAAAPLFRGGSLRHQRRAAIEAYESARQTWRQVVLSGFQQVADALRGLEHDAESVAALSRSVEAADAALKLLHANYEAGLASYLQVLVADQQYRQARIAEIQGRAQRLQDTAALFVALGGGWWRRAEEVTGEH